MEKEILEKILAILEAQDAKIKALEAQVGDQFDYLQEMVQWVYEDKDEGWYNDFAARHKSKFEPYLGVMDKVGGGDTFRAVYDKSKDLMGSMEDYDEDAYVGAVLADIVEVINGLKSVVPPEAQEALEEAQEAVVEASIEAQGPAAASPAAAEPAESEGDAWPEEEMMKDLEKERSEGREMYR